jgi:hypothetical protein
MGHAADGNLKKRTQGSSFGKKAPAAVGVARNPVV